jgi:hypothetical protein
MDDMIRREEHGDFLLITQHDHALLAGELAEAFGNGRFASPRPHASAIVGIAQHDCGWPLHDDEPTLSHEGKPLDVFETTPEIGLKVWTASAERASALDPYAGLMVSLHVLSLSVFATTRTGFIHEKWDLENAAEKFAVTKFQHREIERQEKLRMQLGLRTDRPTHHKLPREAAQKKEDELTFNFRLLQAMDLVSLAACCTKPPSNQTQEVLEQPGGAALHLDLARAGSDVVVTPWPFAVELIELKIPAARLAARSYENVEDFRAAYATAQSELLTCRILPKASLP